MTSKYAWNLAYVLHTRAFRETSLLVELFSQEHGRITAVARGAKRGAAKTSSIMQPFMPLQVSFYGDGDLVTLTGVEASGCNYQLYGRSAICGLYINELLVKLMPKWDPCNLLFAGYENCLNNLAFGVDKNINNQIVLRKFETLLLKSLGYGLQLTIEVDTRNTVQAQNYYTFDPILGPKLVHAQHATAIKGASLLALAADNLEDPAVLLDIKRLMRIVLGHHLGARRLITRELL